MSKSQPSSRKPPAVRAPRSPQVDVPAALRVAARLDHDGQLSPEVSAMFKRWRTEFALQQEAFEWWLESALPALAEEFRHEPSVHARAIDAISRPAEPRLSELTKEQIEVWRAATAWVAGNAR